MAEQVNTASAQTVQKPKTVVDGIAASGLADRAKSAISSNPTARIVRKTAKGKNPTVTVQKRTPKAAPVKAKKGKPKGKPKESNVVPIRKAKPRKKVVQRNNIPFPVFLEMLRKDIEGIQLERFTNSYIYDKYHVGFEKINRAKPILAKSGHLIEKDNGRYAIPEQWRKPSTKTKARKSK